MSSFLKNLLVINPFTILVVVNSCTLLLNFFAGFDLYKSAEHACLSLILTLLMIFGAVMLEAYFIDMGWRKKDD